MNDVQARDGNLYVGATRVTLESVVVSWKQGSSPEQIHDDFPTVPLASIYGAIAYYLEHQQEVDRYLRENDHARQTLRGADEAAYPEFYARMRERLTEARAHLGREGVGAGDQRSDECSKSSMP